MPLDLGARVLADREAVRLNICVYMYGIVYIYIAIQICRGI